MLLQGRNMEGVRVNSNSIFESVNFNTLGPGRTASLLLQGLHEERRVRVRMLAMGRGMDAVRMS